MTWTAFYHAMRRGLSEKVNAITRRGHQQRLVVGGQSRSVSTQTNFSAAQEEANMSTEQWDFLILDVSTKKNLKALKKVRASLTLKCVQGSSLTWLIHSISNFSDVWWNDGPYLLFRILALNVHWLWTILSRIFETSLDKCILVQAIFDRRRRLFRS